MLKDLPEYFGQQTTKNTEKEDCRKDYIGNEMYQKLLITENKNLEQLKMEFEKDIINKLIGIYGDSVEGKKNSS